ncbi:putative plasmid-related protein [Vibrio maritimus]|uniref:Putative plasmid-related protein n=1 Tax=Vibrio maritimus TaxID=990268 RepID=A0A090TCD9_9VIBR|nr:putative plasmid-related protein [Vibrio maritimus]
MNLPTSLPTTHQALLLRIIDSLSQDARICGIGASGSFATDTMDEYSDLDLVIAIHPESVESVMNERFQLIERIGGSVAAFTGEHVGEPRLVIALFEPDAVHVDFKFVSLPDAAMRVDDTQVLWQQGSLLTDCFSTKQPYYPQPDPQWIEDRFWIWTHYAATKIARGEYFEALDFISFIRHNVLSPLALKQNGLTPSGVRTIEKRLPALNQQLKNTIATTEKTSLVGAFEACIALYLELRGNEESVVINHQAQKLCLDYFNHKLT